MKIMSRARRGKLSAPKNKYHVKVEHIKHHCRQSAVSPYDLYLTLNSYIVHRLPHWSLGLPGNLQYTAAKLVVQQPKTKRQNTDLYLQSQPSSRNSQGNTTLLLVLFNQTQKLQHIQFTKSESVQTCSPNWATIASVLPLYMTEYGSYRSVFKSVQIQIIKDEADTDMSLFTGGFLSICLCRPSSVYHAEAFTAFCIAG